MPNKLSVLFAFLCLIFVSSGCQTAKNVTEEVKQIEFRRYVQDKARVDQEMQGNAGYIGGTPQPVDRSDFKKTKRVYVFEFNKPVENAPDEVFEREAYESDTSMSNMRVPRRRTKKTIQRQPEVNIPSFEFDDEEFLESDEDSRSSKSSSSSNNASSYTEYTVQKDDTLQKISKKFYDSYSKWPKIYEANRNKIKNPDSISPGITLRIPAN